MNQYMLSYFDKQFNNKSMTNCRIKSRLIFLWMNIKFLLGDNKKLSNIKYNDIHNFLSKRIY